MKIIGRISIALTVAASLFAASCSKFEEKGETLSSGKVFHASFEAVEAPATRTYLDSDHKLLWTADDRLSVFEGNTYNQQYRYTGQTGKTSADFEKVSSGLHSGNTISTIYAVYPYSPDTEISNAEKLAITFPSVQQYAAGSFGLGANTMVAVTNGTSDTFLAFKNLCGYLVIRLYGEGTVKQITLTGNNGEKIAGPATVTATYGSDPSVSITDTATDEITLDCGSGVILGSTSQAATEFWFCIPPVTFSKGFSIKVTNTAGGVMGKSISSSRTISRNTINTMSALEAKFTEPVVPIPEMVDLGLPSGLKWASFNLGASKPEEYGGYYQWAGLQDVTSTSIYLDLDNCPYHTGSSYSTGWTKYVPSSYSSYWSGTGSPDNKTVLDPEDDVAHVTLGDKWRMPTIDEWTELEENCTWVWVSLNGINGYKVTSNISGHTDKWIFLPAAGFRGYDYLGDVGSYGYYWSSSLNTDYPNYAFLLYFLSDFVHTNYYSRCLGQSVRPVSE